MSDIFISYARSTADQAQTISDALRALGYGVWRDDELPAHRSFAEVIEERLKAAKAVVVIWSAEAVKSEWVQAEADRARMDHKLVQLTVDGALPPIPFDRIQCADMAGWSGQAGHAGWRKVLASIGELAGAASTTPAALLAPAANAVAHGNLPRRLGAIIGREAELTQLAALLENSDLVTVTGTGGVGKTRIVIEVGLAEAGRFRDGAWLVELAPVTDPEQVSAAVARAMGLDLPAGEEPRQALVERLRPRDCLIILDNCEHLIDAVAGLAEEVLQGSANVKLLASSQELLGVEGERVFRLRSLNETASARLFAERAQAADTEFGIGAADEAAVSAICRRLDGIPLAIEMAAARAPTLGCAALLQGLDDRFRLLTGGRRTALPRQRTLVAALDWSHDLLSERDAAVFRRLSVFSGGFTLEAARAVCASEQWDGVEVAEAVASLVAKSLIATETAWEARRYRLLETTRIYALEKLAAAAETQGAQQSHAGYFATLAARSFEDYMRNPVSDADLAQRYSGEVDNIARAVDWAFGPEGDAQLGIRLVSDALPLMAARSFFTEFVAWAEQAVLRLTSEAPPAVRARLLASRALAYIGTSAVRMLEFAEEAVDVCRADGDAYSLYTALRARLGALWNLGRDEDSLSAIRAEFATLTGQFPSPSRASFATKHLMAFVSVFETGAPRLDLLDAAIAEARAMGAEGDALLYRSIKLRYFPPGDIDTVVDNWRKLFADLRGGLNHSDVTIAVVVGELITVLAKRAAPADLDEALQLGRGYAHRDVEFGGVYTLAGLAWLALKSGRAPLAGRLAGRLGRVTADMGPRSPQRRAFDNLLPALQAELPQADLDRLMAEGANLSAEDARRLALGG